MFNWFVLLDLQSSVFVWCFNLLFLTSHSRSSVGHFLLGSVFVF